jgi:hypothetical protein
VLEHLFDSHEESFKTLPRLLLAINESNPEIVIDWTHKRNLDDSTMIF